VLVVAHRRRTILTADQIVVLDHGRVVETGAHSELFRLGGLYTQLVTPEIHSSLAEVVG
jgi:ABC-type multidrug transport system fused ATPase/permease subunit